MGRIGSPAPNIFRKAKKVWQKLMLMYFFCDFTAIVPINCTFLAKISQTDQLKDQILPVKAKISQTDQLNVQFNYILTINSVGEILQSWSIFAQLVKFSLPFPKVWCNLGIPGINCFLILYKISQNIAKMKDSENELKY